jgi:hypothetical protein
MRAQIAGIHPNWTEVSERGAELQRMVGTFDVELIVTHLPQTTSHWDWAMRHFQDKTEFVLIPAAEWEGITDQLRDRF